MRIRITKKGLDWLAERQGWCSAVEAGIVSDDVLAKYDCEVEELAGCMPPALSVEYLGPAAPAGIDRAIWLEPCKHPRAYADWIRPLLIKALKKLKPQMLRETGQC
jgi:hypothetical protein